jgi:hypothetical protein
MKRNEFYWFGAITIIELYNEIAGNSCNLLKQKNTLKFVYYAVV